MESAHDVNISFWPASGSMGRKLGVGIEELHGRKLTFGVRISGVAFCRDKSVATSLAV